MMMYLDEFENHIRRIAQEVLGRSQFKGTLVCTAYNPATHAVKGILLPHGIESGWVPVSAMHVGNGFGILAGPRVGSADALDGQQFDVHFDAGDPDTLVAHHRHFSNVEPPPPVESGEILIKDENGNQFFFAQDKSVTITGQNGSVTKHHTDGTVSMTPGTGKMAYHGGDPDDGKSTFDFVMTASGQPSTNVKAKIG